MRQTTLLSCCSPTKALSLKRASLIIVVVALALPFGLCADGITLPLLDLGSGSGDITFGITPPTVSLASGDITGTGSYETISLPWTFTTTPSSLFDLVSGDVQESVTDESISMSVNDGAYGDSISGAMMPFGSPANFFTVTPDGTGGDYFTGIVDVQSVSEGFLLGELDLTSAELESEPLQLTFHIDCGDQDPCIAATDPTGTILDTTLGPAPATSTVPEPSFVFLLAGVLALLPLRRLHAKRS